MLFTYRMPGPFLCLDKPESIRFTLDSPCMRWRHSEIIPGNKPCRKGGGSPPSGRREHESHFKTATASRSRRIICARLLKTSCPRNREGAGKTGCALHPRSRVAICAKECATRAYRFSGNTPAFLRNGFTAYIIALPGERAFLPPSPARSVCFSRT